MEIGNVRATAINFNGQHPQYVLDYDQIRKTQTTAYSPYSGVIDISTFNGDFSLEPAFAHNMIIVCANEVGNIVTFNFFTSSEAEEDGFPVGSKITILNTGSSVGWVTGNIGGGPVDYFSVTDSNGSGASSGYPLPIPPYSKATLVYVGGQRWILNTVKDAAGGGGATPQGFFSLNIDEAGNIDNMDAASHKKFSLYVSDDALMPMPANIVDGDEITLLVWWDGGETSLAFDPRWRFPLEPTPNPLDITGYDAYLNMKFLIRGVYTADFDYLLCTWNGFVEPGYGP